MQRRAHNRYELWFPVELRGEQVEGMAVNHNVSAGGMLIALSAKLEEGAEIQVSFRMPPNLDRPFVVPGKITRVEKNRADPDGVWPYRVAVAFDEVDPELVPHLQQAIKALAQA